jgi:hypothetical protein
MTIPKDSKLYRRDDYYISQNEDAHNNGLPAVKTAEVSEGTFNSN